MIAAMVIGKPFGYRDHFRLQKRAQRISRGDRRKKPDSR